MNWKKVIKDILNKGYSQVSLAEASGTTQVTIHHLKEGIIKEPKYGIGSRIFAIYTDLYPKHRIKKVTK